MEYYQCKTKRLAGTSYKEVWKFAQGFFRPIKQKTKRKPYIRSRYFNKEKIFLDFYFIHLAQKREPDKVRRLKLFPAAMELTQNTRAKPEEMQNPSVAGEKLYRFFGQV